MRDRRIGAVLVAEADGRLIGIFTGRAAVHRVLAEGKSAERTTLAEVMTSDPETLPPSDTAIEPLRTMADGRFRHVPIVHQGKVVGIVSRFDFSGIELDRLDEGDRTMGEDLTGRTGSSAVSTKARPSSAGGLLRNKAASGYTISGHAAKFRSHRLPLALGDPAGQLSVLSSRIRSGNARPKRDQEQAFQILRFSKLEAREDRNAPTTLSNVAEYPGTTASQMWLYLVLSSGDNWNLIANATKFRSHGYQ